MGSNISRENARKAMTTLRDTAQDRLRQEGNEDLIAACRVETEGGLTISDLGGWVMVYGDFETDERDEYIEVCFFPDTADIADTAIEISWSDQRGQSGVDQLPMREFPAMVNFLLSHF